MRGRLVSAGSNGAHVPGVPAPINGEGWIVMAENRAEATGMGETKVMAVTGRVERSASRCVDEPPSLSLLVSDRVWVLTEHN